MRTEAYVGETLCPPAHSKGEIEQREAPAQTVRVSQARQAAWGLTLSRWPLCVIKALHQVPRASKGWAVATGVLLACDP